jgi:condensin complex subunit 3
MASVQRSSFDKSIRQVFQEAQNSIASHRKLVNTLRNIQEQYSLKGEDGEQLFINEILCCIDLVLPVKRSESCADRLLKFCVFFIHHLQEKGLHVRVHILIY